MLIYCTRCVMPNTNPDLSFDEEGVCNACAMSCIALPSRCVDPGIGAADAASAVLAHRTGTLIHTQSQESETVLRRAARRIGLPVTPPRMRPDPRSALTSETRFSRL